MDNSFIDNEFIEMISLASLLIVSFYTPVKIRRPDILEYVRWLGMRDPMETSGNAQNFS